MNSNSSKTIQLISKNKFIKIIKELCDDLVILRRNCDHNNNFSENSFQRLVFEMSWDFMQLAPNLEKLIVKLIV